ncbi:hypothetical protein [Paraflavitalea speifideaquila]|uniref:hypothetical protein n=1 Tax=Paraflavitalea speifideaquila TaxID=3076558 RepID=UPI0028ED7C6F|nr:hypothetical protein [Paraflavitalea speifideiaquila]
MFFYIVGYEWTSAALESIPANVYSSIDHGIVFGGNEFYSLVRGKNTWSELIGVISYVLIFLFLCLGLSILNDNFPDNPLTLTQKRRFNILFLVNFILIAFLFAKTVAVWRIMPFINIGTIIKSSLFFNLLFFIFQTIVLLYSIFYSCMGCTGCGN